ncbi:hypothetical protein AURDEDRAFT_175307 [Auricularia subglabra TFB-10046 SS5]|uniref:Uncharacterized protein n=1 Tax=Auricularia subglabra (strain TFB-10046 / SS5) TaxID=717982 RepID=J0D8L9_AURST|nr:hypothetical protein AURDEDRAFT_175307 [Auricularia subglabra TFB-10046 SS5]
MECIGYWRLGIVSSESQQFVRAQSPASQRAPPGPLRPPLRRARTVSISRAPRQDVAGTLFGLHAGASLVNDLVRARAAAVDAPRRGAGCAPTLIRVADWIFGPALSLLVTELTRQAFTRNASGAEI